MLKAAHPHRRQLGRPKKPTGETYAWMAYSFCVVGRTRRSDGFNWWTVNSFGKDSRIDLFASFHDRNPDAHDSRAGVVKKRAIE
jgi:hypothetical protein